jgi:cytochrome b561
MQYARPIRILHLCIMITIMLQLISEQLMQVPQPGQSVSATGALFFGFHQFIGFVALITVLVYLIVVMEKYEDRVRLFPWLASSGRSDLWLEIKRDVPGWFRGKLRSPDEANLIAGTVHGMGISLALLLGITGSIIYLEIKPDGGMSPALKLIRQCHEIMGVAMWFFTIGHAAMALIHQLRGHGILQAMFRSAKEDN